jgi:hypothetical protein
LLDGFLTPQKGKKGLKRLFGIGSRKKKAPSDVFHLRVQGETDLEKQWAERPNWRHVVLSRKPDVGFGFQVRPCNKTKGANESPPILKAGALITTIAPGGPAWCALPTLHEDDKIININGVDCENMEFIVCATDLIFSFSFVLVFLNMCPDFSGNRETASSGHELGYGSHSRKLRFASL